MPHELRCQSIDVPELDAFLLDYVAVCARHGMQFYVYDYGDGGGVMSLEPFDGNPPYLDLDEARGRLDFICRANATIEAKYAAKEKAAAEKLAALKAEATADPAVALEGLLRNMPSGHWSDELAVAKASAEKALLKLRKPSN